MKVIKFSAIFLIAVILLFGLFLLYATIFNYNPDYYEVIYKNDSSEIIPDTISFKLISWNIGYCGLDKSMDFFYDGGKMVRPDNESVNNNLKAITNYLENNDDAQFILLQEVDIDSKRSYSINELEHLQKQHTGYEAFFGKNYDVSFVPVPVYEPMGKVVSGVATFSRYSPTISTRFSYPGNYSWPNKVFQLDRCYLENRYKLSSGKELIIINIHNSAYDDGTLRKMQVEHLKKVIDNEYNKGNYVVVGGDWNECPPGFKNKFENSVFDTLNLYFLPENYLPGWQWAYDAKTPSNRRVDAPFQKNKTMVTLIDFFLLSPNIELVSIKGDDLQFENSDHNPVHLTIKLKTN